MALLQRTRILSNERLDIPDFNRIEDFVCADFRAIHKKVLANENFVVQGFVASGIGTNTLSVVLAESAAIFGSNDGTLFIGASSLAPLSTTSLSPSTTNYIEIFVSQDTGGADSRAFWDQTAAGGSGAEFSQIVDTFTFLKANLSISTSNFSGTSDKAKICEVDVNGSGVITAIRDSRDLYYRLGRSSNPAFAFPWSSRTEPANTSFTGADKDIKSQKQLNDALANELREIKNTTYWFNTVSYTSNIRGTASERIAARIGILTDAIGDEQEDRSGYIRSDDPIAWDGTSLSFTADLILEFVNTKSGVLSQHTVPMASSPIALNNLESAYVLINRSLTSETLAVVKSGTTPIPAQSQAEKDVFVLFRRQDAVAGHFLHIPFHKQLITPGSTVRLGATGSSGGGGGGTSPIIAQNVPSGLVDGSNDTFTLPSAIKTGSAALVVLNGLKVPIGQVTVTGTSVVFSGPSIPQPGQLPQVLYISDTINTMTSAQEVPSGLVNGLNDTFVIAGTPANAASILVFVDGKKANVSEWSLSGSQTVVFVSGSIPQIGQSVEVWYVTNIGTSSVVQEVPSGTVDGTNNIFTLSVSAPYKSAVGVFVDGIDSPLTDWNLVAGGSEVLFVPGSVPQPGQRVELYYFVISGGGGGSSESLQDAYNVGSTITTTPGVPFTVGGSATKVAQFNGDIGVTGVIDPKGMTFDPQASTPLQPTDNGIWVDTAGDLIHSRPSMPDVNVTQAAASAYHVNRFTLSPTDISNKFVTLSSSPATPSATILDVIGGVAQDYSVDFTVSGTTLSWSGLGLDGILSSGDKLIVQFN